MKQYGSLIVLSGPSGVGKSTLVDCLKQAYPALKFSISCTTRAPRGTEQHGKEYYFLNEEEFSRQIAAGAFVEYAQIFTHRYGTLKSEVLQYLEHGEDVLLDIDVQGARQVREALKSDPVLARCTDFIFILPPSLAVLEARLRGRKTDSEEQIALRLAQSRKELAFWHGYDYAVVNNDVERAAADLISIVRSGHCRTGRCGIMDSDLRETQG